MSRVSYTKQPCEHCPYRRDVTPFLHPARGEELAYLAENRYNDFPCHKTTIHSRDEDSGEMEWGPKSLTCAGFLSMQVNWAGAACPDGFEPSDLVYSEPYEMADAYAEAWGRKRP
jgi:hypothetical protein